VIAGLIFFGITRLATVPQNQRIRQRVLDHTEGRNIRRSERRQRRTLAELAAAVNQRLRGIPQLQRVDRLLEAAGIPASSGAVLVGSALLALVLALFAAVTTGSGTFVFIFFVLGLAGPVFLLRRLGRRRVGAIERQLPDVLATIASSLRVGHGLKQALQTVASEGSPPVSVELRRVLSEARLGRPLEEALVAMCERLGSEDLLYIATAVDVQTQVGGSLSGVFETVSVTVRERQQHRRRVRSITSTGRATATVMSLMPLGFLLLLLVVAPGYVTPFLSSHLGHVLMLASMVSIGIGAFLLSRIVSVKS
jgi:tight adherence protein B